MRKTSFIIIAIIVAMLLLFTGCDDESNGSTRVEVTSITLSSTAVTLDVGDSCTISASVYPSNADDKIIIWSTSDDSVATVNGGYVTATGYGVALITAYSVNGISAVCQVTVEKECIPITAISLNFEELNLTVGDEFTLVASVLPQGHTDILSWTSSDDGVVQVVDGKILCLATGTASVTLSATSGVSATCVVQVLPDSILVESVEFDITSYSCEVSDGLQLTATVLPSDATDKSLIWQSSDIYVAIVSNGTVVAVGEGTAIISATSSNGKSAYCVITVQEKEEIIPVAEVYLNFTEVRCNVGDSFELIATVLPENATNKEVVWSTTNSEVVSVSGGVVEVIGVGSAIVKVESNGGLYAECVISVEELEFANATMYDKLFVYDGTVKSLIVEGAPSGTNITYVGNDKTDEGLYTVRAILEKIGYKTKELEAEMRIVAPYYNINYVLGIDDAVNPNPETYTTYCEPELLSPVSESFDFDGWYEDEHFDKKITKVPYESYGDKTYYAKWVSRYTVEDGKIISISNHVKEEITDLILPQYINGVKITAISERVFADSCLESIVIPSSIEVIEDGAFENCYKLKTVVFEENSKLEEIRSCAFWDCTSLEEIILPLSLDKIGDFVFYNCHSLKKIVIPASVVEMGSSVFMGCSRENLKIYCEANKKPSSWADDWCDLSFNITWSADIA